MGLDIGEELREFAIGDGGEEGLAIVEMVINGHGSDAHGLRDAAHADRFRPFFFQDGEGNAGDAFGGVVARAHLYSV